MIAMLDYSKPPPGCREEKSALRGWCVWVPKHGPIFRYDLNEALAAAWAYYKAEHDPPWLERWYGAMAAGTLVTEGMEDRNPRVREEAIRAAAWAWHDRRHALAQTWARIYESDGDARQLSAVRYTGNSDAMEVDTWWPRCLTWSDEQVAEVERWLEDSTAAIPEVLR